MNGLRMESKTYTTAQAAAMIGISRQALYTWMAERRINAPKTTQLGGRSMRFWTKAQIDAAKKVKGTQKRGRVSKKKK
jgi:excisionase family DNA binding protein